MIQYHKIEAVFNRDTQGSRKLIWGDFRNEAVKYLANNLWLFSEKIDGMNIRVHWDGHTVEFGGRTDRANIPPKLLTYLNETFKSDAAEELFEQKFGESDVILFGEGYGPGIQMGWRYRSDMSFILFDVFIGSIWLERENVEDIAKTFGIDVVPIVSEGTIYDAVKLVESQPASTIGTAKMEGVVARPAVELVDRLGNRIITKIKCRDFV